MALAIISLLALIALVVVALLNYAAYVDPLLGQNLVPELDQIFYYVLIFIFGLIGGIGFLWKYDTFRDAYDVLIRSNAQKQTHVSRERQKPFYKGKRVKQS
jgi:hypothetical protein